MDRSLVMLFSASLRSEIRRALDEGVMLSLIDGIPVLYMGNLPYEKNVLLASFSSSATRQHEEMYISALEASLMGYDVLTEADTYGMTSVIQGAEDGGGRVHLVSAIGIEGYRERYRKRMIRILLTGGSVISTVLSGKDIQGARELSCRLASSALLATGRGAEKEVSMLLDDGKEAAILRSSLENRMGRDLFLSGCRAVSSFSSLFENPSAVVFETVRGRYSFMGKEYDAALVR